MPVASSAASSSASTDSRPRGHGAKNFSATDAGDGGLADDIGSEPYENFEFDTLPRVAMLQKLADACLGSAAAVHVLRDRAVFPARHVTQRVAAPFDTHCI